MSHIRYYQAQYALGIPSTDYVQVESELTGPESERHHLQKMIRVNDETGAVYEPVSTYLTVREAVPGAILTPGLYLEGYHYLAPLVEITLNQWKELLENGTKARDTAG